MSIEIIIISKASNEPMDFIELDKIICKEVLQVEIDPINWGGGKYDWYGKIGGNIAWGNNLGSKQLRESLGNEELALSVITFLEENYTSWNSWDLYKS